MRRIYWLIPVILTSMLVFVACSTAEGPTPVATATTITPLQPRPNPTPQLTTFKPAHAKPGPATERIFFKAFNVDQAPLDFKNGAMDLYLFSLKTAAARELQDDPKVRLDRAPATSISIILNPAPAPQGKLNPFSIKAVRQAFQSLVNRNFIANEIYQGQALPMLTHLSPTDFDYLTVFEQIRGTEIRYDPEFARSIIEREMRAAGAELVDGKWHFDESLIRLKFIIRVEDERRDVGSLLRGELEKAGFEVAPSFKPFADAVLTVYSSDPQAFQWHLYTEGWGRGSPSRYDFATINAMAAPWQGNMPGWREVGFWQYENAELDQLGQRLFTGSFENQAQRDAIYRKMTAISLDESVRVWIATIQNSFPISKELMGVTSDLVAGPKSPRTIREAYIPSREALTVGHLWVWTERTTWNPVGGFSDVYSSDIFRNLYDPPLWNHPFTGIPMSNRAGFSVETNGPIGKLPVPQDAVMWDVEADKWTPVGDGIQTTSKVTFDYTKYFTSNWHHGQRITMADVVYSIAQSYELAFDPNKSRIETALGVTSRPYLETFRGYRLVGNNQLEVYVDLWHFEQNQIAAYASPSSISMPWELLAAMDDLVFEQRRAAYSDTAAGRFNVPWISLVMKRDAGLVERAIRTLDRKGTLPKGVFVMGNQSLVSQEEASSRYRAATTWFDKHAHLFISNGPFSLERYDPPAQFAEIEAFRDATYPFKPGDWYLGPAPQLTITRVQADPLEIGETTSIVIELEGPGTLGIRYVLIDPANNNVVATGEGKRSGNSLVITIDASATVALDPGLYNLFLAGFSSELATITERKVELELQP